MLVSATEIINKAHEGHYAIGAFNTNNLEWTKSLLKAAQDAKAPIIIQTSEGVSVGIFPEGTRNKIEGEVGAFHNGAFIAAMKIKAPIVVCALHNTHGVNDNLLFKAHKIKLNCVKVYYYEDYKDMDANKLGDEIHALMVEDLKNK